MSSTPHTDYPYNLGAYSRKITTGSAEAQRWFDRGLNWCFGYHHQEAGACFAKALECDPDCAMAYWGIAYASGPNYNMPWEFLDLGARAHFLGIAYDAAQAAHARSGAVSEPERALIEALAARYPQREAIEDQRPWNDAFADAMRASAGEADRACAEDCPRPLPVDAGERLQQHVRRSKKSTQMKIG